MQAFFKYRIEKLKVEEDAEIPKPSESSNVWLNDKTKHTSTFYINYSERHNYQINLSSKLRSIEDEFLKNSVSFGYVKGHLRNNPSAIGFESLQFVISDLTSIIPNPILKLRKKIFERVKSSNENEDGVFETSDIFNFQLIVREYIQKLSEWTTSLKNQVSSEELNPEEKSRIQHFLTELQILDIARIKTKLPDGQPTEALLLSQLHPLRLAWSLELLEVFNNWEQRTKDYPG